MLLMVTSQLLQCLVSMYSEVLHHSSGGPHHGVHHGPALAGHGSQEDCPHLQLQSRQSSALIHPQQLIKHESGSHQLLDNVPSNLLRCLLTHTLVTHVLQLLHDVDLHVSEHVLHLLTRPDVDHGLDAGAGERRAPGAVVVLIGWSGLEKLSQHLLSQSRLVITNQVARMNTLTTVPGVLPLHCHHSS